MSKFISVMRADVEGFNVIRAIGLRFLFQVILFAGLYKMVNETDGMSWLGLEAGVLGAKDFVITLIIAMVVTIYYVYRSKLHAIKLMEKQQ